MGPGKEWLTSFIATKVASVGYRIVWGDLAATAAGRASAAQAVLDAAGGAAGVVPAA
jgi:hypothetical protein